MAIFPKTKMLTLLIYLSSTTIASSTETPEQILHILRQRQSTCPSSNPVSCSAIDPKLPGNFCCGAGTTCISLDSSSSALCCPANSSCSNIQTIDCDVSLQNPSSFSQILTSRTSDKLPTCGGACCPFGYICKQSNGSAPTCQLDTSKAISTRVSSATPSPTSLSSTSRSASSAASSLTSSSASAPKTLSTSTTSTAVTTPTLQASGIDSTRPQPSHAGNAFPPGVFLAGFFPGMLIGALSVLAWVIVTGRHKRQTKDRSGVYSTYGKSPEISNPYGNSSNSRADFVRKTKTIGHSAKSLFGKKHSDQGTPGLPFDSADNNWRNLTPPDNTTIPANALGMLTPVKSTSQSSEQGSSRGPITCVRELPNNKPESGGESRTSVYNRPTYPMTPNRTTAYTTSDDPIGEIIKVYTPPSMDRPPATVTPLRGMNMQRRSRSSDIDSDYKMDTGPKSQAQTQYPYDRSAHNQLSYQTLTPTRYNGGDSHRRPAPELRGYGDSRDRPETSFTEFLEEIKFPDPMKQGNIPDMPVIPKEYR